MSAPRIHRLANGVTLVCDPAPGYHTLALSVVAGRGARWEDEARCGWSHLLEHMVFKGAGSRSAREIVEAIEADGGQINAATSHERTSFQIRALAGGLPLALGITADLVLRPTLNAEDLAREKNVIGQEIAEAADTPDDQIFELAQAAAFAGQPLGRPILGSLHTLSPADPPALETWRGIVYAPDRLVVSVSGKVDEDLLLREAEALFGAAHSPDAFAPDAATFGGGAAFERRKLEQAHLVFLMPGPALTDGDYWPFRILAETLGGGMSSRLFQEVRERLGLAYAIDAYAESWWDTGVLGVYAGCAPGDAGRLAEAVANEIKAMASGVSGVALARAKAQLKASLFMSGESLSARAEQSAAQILVFGDVVPPSVFAEAIDAVQSEDIATLVTHMIGGGRFAAAALGPRAAASAASRFAQRLYS